MSTSLPAPIVATPGDLPPAVAERLAATGPEPGEPATTTAAGIPFASIAWGEPADRPLILIHGVTASSRVWWRVGPALAASGRRVVAVDLPGHGLTGHWAGHHVFRETAADVAAWIRAAGLDLPGLQVVGHSWGGMIAAALPIAGIRPATLVLLDPPAVPWSVISQMASDPSEQTYPDLAAGMAALAAANPEWSGEDVRAKAEALVQLDVGCRALGRPRQRRLGRRAGGSRRPGRDRDPDLDRPRRSWRPAACCRTVRSRVSRRGSARTTS